MNYLKKILGELAMVLDQVEAELEKRKLEYQGELFSSHKQEQSRASLFVLFFTSTFSLVFDTLQVKSVSCGYVDLNLR